MVARFARGRSRVAVWRGKLLIGGADRPLGGDRRRLAIEDTQGNRDSIDLSPKQKLGAAATQQLGQSCLQACQLLSPNQSRIRLGPLRTLFGANACASTDRRAHVYVPMMSYLRPIEP